MNKKVLERIALPAFVSELFELFGGPGEIRTHDLFHAIYEISVTYRHSARKYLHGLELLKRWDKGTNLQEATALFAEATKSDPKFALGFAALADAQRFTYSLTHDKSALDTASANAEEAMRLDPRLTRVQVSWGRIQAVRGDNDLAMFSFERALEIDPNNADVQGAIPRQYERLGRFGDAEAAYHRSLALDPDSMFLHNAYANFLFRQSRYSDAAREWRGVVRIAPDSAVAYVNLGAALFEDGETAEAITIFDRAVKLKPNYQAYSNLGLEYTKRAVTQKLWRSSKRR